MACNLGFLTVLLLLGTAMYVAGGIYGLSGTLTLLEKYGPVNGSGNPALDPPPQLRWDPQKGQYVPLDSNNPGNRVPKAFKICIGILGGWAVIILVSTFVFIVDSTRNNAAIKDSSYVGDRTSDSSISCTSFLTGYCVFLIVAWFVQAGFAVLPLLEYRITMQRCWDLNNPDFAETTKRAVCVDLVQYGLVLFRETSYSGFGLICGPGGSYNPPRGNLEGLCQNYSPPIAAFVICFAGAGISTIALVLFTIHHSTNFAVLKIRRYEGPQGKQYIPSGYPPEYARKSMRSRSLSNYSEDYPQVTAPASYSNGVNLVNPNYGASIAETRQSQRNPIPEVMALQKYRDDKQNRPPSYDDEIHEDDSYEDNSEEEYQSSRHSKPRHKTRNHHHHGKGSEYSYRGSRVSESNRPRRHTRHSDEEDLSARYSSDDDHSRRSRRRPENSRRNESPNSDYYMSQDRRRQPQYNWT